MTNERPKSQMEITSSNTNSQTTTSSKHLCPEKTPLCNRQLNFNRVYPSTTETKRRLEDDEDESSLSGSDIVVNECDQDFTVIKKSNEVQSLLKKTRYKKRKKAIQSTTDAIEPCARCKSYDEEIKQIKQRVVQLEKLVPVVKKFRVKTPATSTNQTNSVIDTNEIYKNIEQVTGVNPNQLKSTPTPPTMIMRELIKKCGHIADRTYVTTNQNLFKNFIQMKCMIIDDDIDTTWKEILESLSRQHIDEENNKKKKINKQALSISNSTTSELSQASAIHNEEETTATISSESPQPM